MEIPYAHTTRPDTGVSNATLGIWLFLSSEVMLFGGLFSAYAILRAGADAWPDQQALMDLRVGVAATGLLLASSLALRLGRVWTTVALGAAFLAVELGDVAGKMSAGFLPATNNFLGLYYALTSLHALHVAGGLLVLVAFAANRKPLAAPTTYWHFVAGLWTCLFVVLYLL